METKYRKALSKKESRVLSELSYQNKTIFTLNDIKRTVTDSRNFLHHLTEKKWILKVRRGVYIIVPLNAGKEGASAYTLHSFVIASVLTKPYYIGYWSALNYHGLTEQVSPSVHIATTNLRHSREILNTRFVFVKICKKKMFGIDEIDMENRKIAISSPEKTVIDCLDHPEYGGGIDEIAKAIYFAKSDLDAKKIVKYAKNIGNTAVIKRLGYIVERFEWDDWLKLLSEVKLKSGYAVLDPHILKKGSIKEKWKLIVNVPIDPKRWMS